MPERAGVDDNPDLLELIAVWRDASDDIDGRLKRIWRDIRREVRWVGDGTIRVLRLTAQAERLQELQATAEHQLDVLLQRSRSFLDDGPIVSIYSAGAEVTAAVSGVGFSLTAPHRAAVEALARDTWSDVLAATRFVDRDAKRWVRRVSRKLTGVSIVAGDTALQAGRRFERDLAKEFRARGIGAVAYRDGSRHSFGEYAEMLLRTKTGIAYNAGTTNHARMVGVEWFELLDGSACGLSAHNDPQLANGLIVPLAVAQAYPLAHPNCRRAVAPRPDLTGPVGRSVVSVESRADQEAFEAALARQEAARRRSGRRQRRRRQRRARSTV